jgi:phospholipase A-2-activating protein
MLAIRLFANLFDTAAGRQLAVSQFDLVLAMISSVTTGAGTAPNRNITIAATTVYINYAVYFTTEGRAQSPESAERALQLLDELAKVFSKEKDSEAVYRGLVALGTLVKELGDEVKSAAKEIYDFNSVLAQVLKASPGREPRVMGIVEEIRSAL